MEHAIFISDIPALKYFMLSDFKRIYYGNEFCEHLLPTPEQLASVLEFASENNVSFTLVTPILYEAGIAKVKKLLKRLPGGTEVVINDIGLIDIIKDTDLVPVHGRMLLASIKDPRIDCGTPFQKLFTAHNLQEPYLEILREHGIERVEIDNAGQGYDLKTIKGMAISLYYPYVNCTVTRKCIYVNRAGKSTGKAGGGFVVKCKRQCGGRIIKADIDGSPVSIMGNAQYYRNDSPPENLESTGIDRLVYMPVFTNSNSGISDTESLHWSFPYRTGEHENSWGTRPDETLDKLLKSIDLPEGTKVLDIGCGAGRNAPIMIGNKFNYTGIDVSGEAIELARNKLPDGNFIGLPPSLVQVKM
ncbi:MAG TPA: class I SAM-dependent methyltransferase [bacterium]|nr:class I SAM-dependent methyltransferase [bacterium]